MGPKRTIASLALVAGTLFAARALLTPPAQSAPAFGKRAPKKALTSASGIENPGAATGLIVYGQSSSVGFCDGSAADVNGNYSCAIVRPAPVDAADALASHLVCYDSVNDDYANEGTVLLDLNAASASCRRWSYQQPMLGVVENYRILSGEAPHTLTCASPGQPGIALEDLSDPSIHWTRLVSCVDEMVRVVAASPSTYNSNGQVVIRGLVMIQGETNAINLDTAYVAKVQTFVDDFQTMVKAATGQTSDVQITWDQPSNWRENANTRAITETQLLTAAATRSFLYVIGSKGHANPDFPSTITNQDHAFETNGASALHWSPAWHVWNGWHHAKHLYRAIYGSSAGTPGAPQISTAVWTEGTSTLQVCYQTDYPPMVLDSTVCPEHWNGDNGFEVLHVASEQYNATEFVGSPAITAVAIDGTNNRCVNLTLDAAPHDFGRVEVGNRGQTRTANEPENGCRDFLNTLGNGANTVNIGAPFVQVHDSDTGTQYPISAMMENNWAVIESFGPITNAVAAPTDTQLQYIEIGDSAEHITFPDETPDMMGGNSGITISMWIDPNGAGDGDLIRRGANGSTIFRAFYDNSAGVGGRFDLQIVSVTISSEPTTFPIPEDPSEFVNYIITYDGTQSLGSRVRHVYQCEDLVDNESGAFPATLPDAADSLHTGFFVGSPTNMRYREIAIWDTTATERQMLEICRSMIDVSGTNTTLGAPQYYFRPSCGDDLTTASGITNLGTLSDGTGQNHEAGDLVEDPVDACP